MKMDCFQSVMAKRLLLWYILAISLVVLILSWDIVLGCSLVLVGPAGQKGDLQAFGLFRTAVYDEDGSFLGCVDYSQYWQEQTDERSFGVARVFGGLLAGTTTLATFISLLVQCFNKHGKSWLWSLMTWCYAIAFFSQLFIFAVWTAGICESFEGQESTCSAGSNSITSLLNFILLIGMVVASFNSLPPRNPVFRCWYASDDNSQKFETDSEDYSDDIESQSEISLFSQRRNKKSASKQKKTIDVDETSVEVEFEGSTIKEPVVSTRLRKLDPSIMKPMDPSEQRQVQKPISVPRRDPPVQNTEIQRMFNKIMLKNTDGKEKFGLRKVSNQNSHYTRRTSKHSANRPSYLNELQAVQARKFISKNATPTKLDGKAGRALVPPRNFFIGRKSAAPVAEKSQQPQKQEQQAVEKEGDISKKSLVPGVLGPKRDPSGDDGSTLKGVVSLDASESVKASVVQEGGSILEAGSILGGAGSSGSSSSDSNDGSDTTASQDTAYFLDRLAKSVELKEGGKRISENRIGERLQLVDEYPVPSDFPTRNANRAMAGLVKVRTEYLPEGRKTIKEEFHTDGSRTVITMLDPTDPTADSSQKY